MWGSRVPEARGGAVCVWRGRERANFSSSGRRQSCIHVLGAGLQGGGRTTAASFLSGGSVLFFGGMSLWARPAVGISWAGLQGVLDVGTGRSKEFERVSTVYFETREAAELRLLAQRRERGARCKLVNRARAML